MRTKPVLLAAVLGFSLCFKPVIASSDDHVKFSQEFANASLGTDVVIQIPSNKTLVLDGGGPFYLEGKDLYITAAKVLVEVPTVIQSYSDTNVPRTPDGTPPTPPPTGTNAPGTKGTAGAQGVGGDPAGRMLLRIISITSANGATLTIRAEGQKGGRGQKGGQGGQGGIGYPGRDAESDFPYCSRPCPDTGRIGASGGQRGAGGPGGNGGSGGTVYVSSEAHGALNGPAPVLNISVIGGLGGNPGERGERGLGGPGGPRGAGGNCNCSDVPGPGPNGPEGPDVADVTPPSIGGPQGSIVVVP